MTWSNKYNHKTEFLKPHFSLYSVSLTKATVSVILWRYSEGSHLNYELNIWMFQWGFSERKTDGEQSHGKVLSKQKLNCILSCNKECLFQLLKEFRLTYHNSNSMGYFKIHSGAFLHEWHVLPLTWFELQRKKSSKRYLCHVWQHAINWDFMAEILGIQ